MFAQAVGGLVFGANRLVGATELHVCARCSENDGVEFLGDFWVNLVCWHQECKFVKIALGHQIREPQFLEVI
jgi:hypothetical protein